MLLALMPFVRIVQRSGSCSRGCANDGTLSATRKSADRGASCRTDANAFSGSDVTLVPYGASADGPMHVVSFNCRVNVVAGRDWWNHGASRSDSPQDQTQEQNGAQYSILHGTLLLKLCRGSRWRIVMAPVRIPGSIKLMMPTPSQCGGTCSRLPQSQAL
jgi:hypothetical protein